MNFFGEHRGAIDDKGRMRIPNKFRAKLDDDYVVYAGTENCLIVVSDAYFQEKYQEKLSATLLKEEDKQNALRKLSSTVQTPEEDNQGRFILKSKLKNFADIKKKMVFLGVMDRIEIWAEEAYDAKYSVDNIDMMEVVNTLDI